GRSRQRRHERRFQHRAFALHSKAGANRVIYLDFNGHVASATAWNSGTLTARPTISTATRPPSAPPS
ncbi:hypothetical protein, partial [Methylomonas koyamae]|uniref:hypothetical protein n=1 Tax=Methylomonas koyamae TaxID=702114 RepID=UPI0021104EFE